ncbi:MAG: hypothetical protein IT307_04965 [Chloroflexi bacterium]|nr:hypothetical protein [Chloroflexota bacterium]
MSAWALAGVMLGLVAVVFVLYPIWARSRAAERGTAARTPDRHAIYRQVVDIEFDERVGKLTPEDAALMKTRLLSEAADLLRSEERRDEELEVEIEREIAVVRRALTATRAEQQEPATS